MKLNSNVIINTNDIAETQTSAKNGLDFNINPNCIVSHDTSMGTILQHNGFTWETGPTYYNQITINNLIEFEKRINTKVDNFLKFLIIKGVIKEDEYKEFLDSLLVAERLSKE